MATVMVLAAGYGTRLRPLTDEVPKPMVPLGDRPLVAQILAQLKAQGFDSAVLNTHHLPDAFSQLEVPEVEYLLNYEPRILGSGGGVRAVLPSLDSPCVVWNGDIWVRPDLRRLLAALEGSAACLLVAPCDGVGSNGSGSIGSGSVGLGEDGRVVRLRGERFGEEVRGADYVGVLALGEKAQAALPVEGCLIGDLCLPLLGAGHRLRTCWHAGPWFDVGSPAGYLAANLDWLDERAAWVARTATVSSAVHCIGAVVGADARVDGSGTLLRSVVWPGVCAQAPLTDAIAFADGKVLRVNGG